jgi:hypothetical protein
VSSFVNHDNQNKDFSWLSWSHHFESFTVATLGWPFWNICVTNDHWYVPLVEITSRSFPHSWLISGFVTGLTQRVPLVEQELLTFRSTLVHPQFLVGFVFLDLVLCVSFVEHCFSFSTFSFGHCFLCSSIYGFWLPLWYLQTLLKCYFWGYWCFTPPCTFYNLSDISWRLALFTGGIQSLSAHT